MPFEIVRNDITKMQTDAIVNAANPRPMVGYGVDSGIHKAAGPGLLAAREEIGELDFGDAAVTPAFDLCARIVIHAVSPLWQGGDKGEVALLENCYKKSLALAVENGCESIAFPLLSAGNHGFPKRLALQTAVGVFSDFLMEHDMHIYLVVFSSEALEVSERLFCSVQSYIDDNYIIEKSLEEYGVTDKREVREMEVRELEKALIRRRRQAQLRDSCTVTMPNIASSAPYAHDCEADAAPEPEPMLYCAPMEQPELSELVAKTEETFSQCLLRLIDCKGLTDPEVYKRANVDRRLFSKIRNNVDYRPAKTTAFAFAVALRLDLAETTDLLRRAGYAITHSSKFDIIVEYFIINRNYDIFEINEVLFAFEQPLIGA